MPSMASAHLLIDYSQPGSALPSKVHLCFAPRSTWDADVYSVLYEDALGAGLRLKYQFPQVDLKCAK